MTKTENRSLLIQLNSKINEYSLSYENGTLSHTEYIARTIPLQTAYAYISTEIGEKIDAGRNWLNMTKDTPKKKT